MSGIAKNGDGGGKNKKQKIEKQRGNAIKPSQRIALLAQLSFELQHDHTFAEELSAIAGDDVRNAALQVARTLGSKPSVVSSILGVTAASSYTTLDVPVAPSPENYLQNSSKSLPILPPILDDRLAKLTFTHRGTLNGAHVYDAGADYERLEYLGDAYLEVIASRLIYHYFPEIGAGKLSSIRESLIKNETLAEFSMAYKFDERAHLPKDFRNQGRENLKKWSKTLGDIFEAYTAAVILSDPLHGFQIVEQWLTSLWKPRLSSHHEEVPLAPDAKVSLQQKLGGRNIRIWYEPIRDPKPIRGGLIYSVGAYLNGWGYDLELLGTGEAKSIKEAGIRAAMKALLNPATAHAGAAKRVLF